MFGRRKMTDEERVAAAQSPSIDEQFRIKKYRSRRNSRRAVLFVATLWALYFAASYIGLLG